MIKKLAFSFLLAIIVILVVGGFFYRQEIYRLRKVLTFFEAENISENFKSVTGIFSTSKVEASNQPTPLVINDNGWALPETFSLDDSVVTTKTFLEHTLTDGLLIYQNDSIRFEYYGNDFEAEDVHISWSMSKSVISALIGIALEEGHISSIEQYATEYLPELKGTGYQNVTIKNLLQMSSGVRFNEDYGDFNSDINRMGRYFALGMPMADFAASLVNENPPGTVNHYVSIDTQVLGMILVKATGQSISEYMKTRLWDPMGATSDAYWIVDNTGMEFALGGLNVTLRDYARLGVLFLDSGRWNGKQVVPEQWVLNSTRPLDPHVQPRMAGNTKRDGYGYQWWIPYGAEDEYNAQGIYDQFIYVDPDKDAVIVKLSSNYHFRNDYQRIYKQLSIALFRDILEK
jgi:CubicO group peptidase (beta-lactamase class C family)